MEKKKITALYGVSTKKQVESEAAMNSDLEECDIPMQGQACRNFINAIPQWGFYRELSEFGVSGYKVSAKERDAIQNIQQEAIAGRFDVLLVFMFDRLGESTMKHPLLLDGL